LSEQRRFEREHQQVEAEATAKAEAAAEIAEEMSLLMYPAPESYRPYLIKNVAKILRSEFPLWVKSGHWSRSA
jgi:hypothetical protein